MNPGDHQWQLPEQLLASIFDALQVANWQRGGGARSAFPKQLDRPGVRPDSKQFGGKPVPMDEMAQWLGWDTSMDGGVTHV